MVYKKTTKIVFAIRTLFYYIVAPSFGLRGVGPDVELLRRHVPGRAHDGARVAALARRVPVLRQAEVHLGDALRNPLP